jgi:4-carboxymuconolactone decarboxylase
LANYTDEVLFGQVWPSPELSPRDRSLVVISALIATNKPAQLQGHLGRALDNGVTPVEASGVLTHLAFYAGWPNAVSALEVYDKVYTARNVDLAALQATSDAPASARAPASPPGAPSSAIAPKFTQLTSEVVVDDLWRRADLSRRDRSLVTIAALAATGEASQLPAYLRQGLADGLTQAQIGEALTHLAFYAGWPKASAAIAVADETFRNSEASITEERLKVVAPGLQPASGPAANFTGSVVVTSPFKGGDGSRIGGATVTFQPGARTNWHTHPLGQLLVITAGEGWVQAQGQPVRVVRPGDVVWTAPGVRHWHGATRVNGMSHVAVAEAPDGKTVTWLEPVSDAQYRSPASPTSRHEHD